MRFLSLSAAAATSSLLLASTAFAAPQSNGYVGPKAAAEWVEAGALNSSDAYTFTISIASADLEGLAAKVAQIAKDDNGKWLSLAQLGKYATPRDADLKAIKKFLKSHGHQDTHLKWSSLNDAVTVTSTVGKVNKMFSTNLKLYSHEGRRGARAKAYVIPAGLAITNVHPLTVLPAIRPLSILIENKGNATQFLEERKVEDESQIEASSLERRAPAACNTNEVNPRCLRALYGTSSYKPTSRETIGVASFVEQNFNNDDLQNFLSQYRPDAVGAKVNVVNLRGAVNDYTRSNAGLEVMLDVEQTVAQSYPLTTTVYNVGNTKSSGDLFYQSFLDLSNMANPPGVFSLSYGSEERFFDQATTTTMCNTLMKLVARGTTVVVASGDSGVSGYGSHASCPLSNNRMIPTYPSNCPYALSVGATQGFDPEVAAGPSIAGFYSGAGFSEMFGTPSYQSAASQAYLKALGSTSQGYYNPMGRIIADVSAQGSRYPVVWANNQGLASGTSAATPTVAALIALINDARVRSGKKRVGFVNPALYTAPASSFNDVTQGGSYGCDGNSALGYPAKPGYDVFGLGTPVFSRWRSIFGV